MKHFQNLKKKNDSTMLQTFWVVMSTVEKNHVPKKARLH